VATNGQKVAQVALAHVGLIENPVGSNTDSGGLIDQMQAYWGLHAEPWCAMYVSYCYRTAGVDDDGVINPGTSTMCMRAAAKNLWRAAGPVPTGAIMILCGIHTEVVISDRGNGLIDCVGGNVNQQVMRTVRSLGGGWRCIVPPAILQGQPEPIRVYGFDDPAHAPKRYGPWHDRSAREAAIASLPPDERRFARRIRIPGRNQYAFDLLNPAQWRFGPWQDKGARDADMASYQKKVGRSMRPWSQPVQPQTGGGGSVTSGETTQ
jgi:hypothetical protein